MPNFEYNIPCYMGPDRWKSIEAYDEEEAAERAAAIYNEDGDYPLMNGGRAFVLIKREESDFIKIFIVSAEPSIDYHVYEEESPQCKHCKKNLVDNLLEGETYEREGNFFCEWNCWDKWYKKKYLDYKKNLEE